MRILLIATLLGATTLPGVLTAQPATVPDFRPLEFLVGSCWVGTFPDGKKTDEHCFEWVFDRKFIRDRHVVRGGPPYEGETIHRWDPVAKRLSYSYWTSDGLVIEGRTDPTPEGIVFPSQYATATGNVELKAVWTRPNPDMYRVEMSERSAGGWKQLWTMDMKRKK